MYVYMDIAANFSCEACGQCCRNDWQVTVDEESYRRNADLFLQAGKQAEFRRAFLPLQEGKSLGEYACIAKKSGGGCWFLTAANLCSLQQQAGHSHLDAVCQTFPRYPMNTARGVELTLSFSCPAVLKRIIRSEPLAIIRSDHSPLVFPPGSFTVHVFPGQQPAFSPLRYYFELEQHFIDILQFRGIAIVQRLNVIKETIFALNALKQDEEFNRNLTRLYARNYDLLNNVPEQVPADCYIPDILVEHFLVNFVFKKPFYTHGLRRGLLLLEHVLQYIQRIRKQASDEAADLEMTKRAVMDVEFQYGHNRRTLLEQVEC